MDGPLENCEDNGNDSSAQFYKLQVDMWTLNVQNLSLKAVDDSMEHTKSLTIISLYS